MSEMNNKQFESSVIQLVFVEPKDQHDRGREAERERIRGSVHSQQPGQGNQQGTYQQQPPPPPPPSGMLSSSNAFTITAPATNPSSDSSRYNTTAGDFIIDAAGRLTRRAPTAQDRKGKSRSRSPTGGTGAGLLTAGVPSRKDENISSSGVMTSLSGAASYRPPACVASECPLHPALVVDYSLI